MEAKALVKKLGLESLLTRYNNAPPSLGTEIKQAIETIKKAQNGKHEPRAPD